MKNTKSFALKVLRNVNPKIARKALKQNKWCLGGEYCDIKTGLT